MEPIEALNRPIKESHKYILAMYADGSYLYILLQHTENRDEIVTERLSLTSEKGVLSIEEAVFSQPILTRPFEKVFFIADSPRFIFIPDAFASTEDNPLYFDFCFPDSEGTLISTDLPQTGAKILFDLNTELSSFVKRTLDRPVLLHRLAPACEYFFRKAAWDIRLKCMSTGKPTISICFVSTNRASCYPTAFAYAISTTVYIIY